MSYGVRSFVLLFLVSNDTILRCESVATNVAKEPVNIFCCCFRQQLFHILTLGTSPTRRRLTHRRQQFHRAGNGFASPCDPTRWFRVILHSSSRPGTMHPLHRLPLWDGIRRLTKADLVDVEFVMTKGSCVRKDTGAEFASCRIIFRCASDPLVPVE